MAKVTHTAADKTTHNGTHKVEERGHAHKAETKGHDKGHERTPEEIHDRIKAAAAENVAEEKASDAPDLFDEYKKALAALQEKHLAPIRKERDALAQRIAEDTRLLAEVDARIAKFTGETTPTRLPPRTSGNGGKRERKTDDQLKGDAQAVYDFVKANPGSSSGAITEATGVDPSIGIRGLLEKYMPGKVKTEGQKRGTTYHAV